MNMFEEAAALKTMIEMRSLTRVQIAEMLGVSISYVNNKLRLLSLDESLQSKIIIHNLSERHARTLLRADKSTRNEILDQICDRSLTVAESEALVEMYVTKEMPKRLGRADGLESIDVFVCAIKSAVEALASKGVKASCKSGYWGDKFTLTISIDER